MNVSKQNVFWNHSLRAKNGKTMFLLLLLKTKLPGWNHPGFAPRTKDNFIITIGIRNFKDKIIEIAHETFTAAAIKPVWGHWKKKYERQKHIYLKWQNEVALKKDYNLWFHYGWTRCRLATVVELDELEPHLLLNCQNTTTLFHESFSGERHFEITKHGDELIMTFQIDLAICF